MVVLILGYALFQSAKLPDQMFFFRNLRQRDFDSAAPPPPWLSQNCVDLSYG